jgi:hypothetical protein
MRVKSTHLPLLKSFSQAVHYDGINLHHAASFAPVACRFAPYFGHSVCRLCDEEKCKVGTFIFPHRSPHSGPEPFGLKGGKPGHRYIMAHKMWRPPHDSKTAKIDSIEIPFHSISKSIS